MKPAKCIKCPLYKDTLVTPIGDTLGASVVFLLESPPSFARVALEGREGSLLREILNTAAKEDASGITADVINSAMYMYSVACASNIKPSVQLVTECKTNVGAQHLLNSGAKVVVAFGAKALAFFGIRSQHKALRGSATSVNFYGTPLQIVTTFSLAQLFKSQGILNMIAKDIQKAAKLVKGQKLDQIDVPKLLEGYDIPTSLEQAKATINEYHAFATKGSVPQKTLMALDFETTTLYSYYKKARVIAVSGAVAPGKAFSIYVDHKDSPYKFRDIIPWIWKILQSPHPKTWWNYKFDYGMAKYALVRQTMEAVNIDPTLEREIVLVVRKTLAEIFTMPIANTQWDGMLGEHMLDENKSGYYSLKQVILDHYPSLAGYEKPLHDQLSSINTAQYESNLTQVLSCGNGTLAGVSPLNSAHSTLDELAIIKKTSTQLKAKARVKGTPQALKDTIDDTLHILKARSKHIKKVQTASTKVLKGEAKLMKEAGGCNNPTYSAATFEEVDTSIMMPYAAIDADLTLRLSTLQRKKAWLEDTKTVADAEGRGFMLSLMNKHYIPLSEVLSIMQVEGVRINREYLNSEYDRLTSEEVRLETDLTNRIATDLGRDPAHIVLNNPVDLAKILIAGYGFPVISTTDKGKASCDKEALEVWSTMNPIAIDVLAYREVVKARSTYVDNLLSLSGFDGRVHGNAWVNGTATGRLSSSDPNLQNQPMLAAGTYIKQAFVPTSTQSNRGAWDRYLTNKYRWKDNEELCVVDLDFAGAEVRGLTVYAQDPALLEALNSGLDMHSWIASIVFELDYDAINTARKVDKAKQTPEEKRLITKRQQAKAIVFGMIFCISAPKLAKDLKIQVFEAEALMTMFFRRFPKIKEYIEDTKYKVRKVGILRTPTGRARRFPLGAIGGSIGAACGRQGVNFLVQGFTSEIVLRVLINLHQHLDALRGRLMLTVHDSIVFEMPRNLLPKLPLFLEERVRDFIETTFPMVPVALPYDVEVGPTYGEAKHSIEAYTQK